MNCQHYENQACIMAGCLAGKPYPIPVLEEHCKTCLTERYAKGPNRVTASLAFLHLLNTDGIQAAKGREYILGPHLVKIECAKPAKKKWSEIGSGLGSVVHDMLSWFFIRPTDDCPCVEVAYSVNTKDSFSKKDSFELCSYMAEQFVRLSWIRAATRTFAWLFLQACLMYGKLIGQVRWSVWIPFPRKEK